MRVAFGFLLLLGVSPARSEEIKDLAGVRRVADAAMQWVGKGDVRAAISALKPYWVLPDAEVEVAISRTQDQRTATTSRFGRALGVEFVDQKVVADSVVRLRYIEKFEKHLFRWQLYFYRPAKMWLFNSFFFDDKIQGLFE